MSKAILGVIYRNINSTLVCISNEASDAIATLATSQFFSELSKSGDVENVREFVTPSFYKFLKSEFENGGDCIPIYKISPNQMKVVDVSESSLLLGQPEIFRIFDPREYVRNGDETFSIRSVLSPTSEREKKSLKSGKLANMSRLLRLRRVVLAAGYPFWFPRDLEVKEYVGWRWVRSNIQGLAKAWDTPELRAIHANLTELESMK
jgi:hypothetical protein